MELILHAVILLLSFYFLAKICDDYFVPALEVIAQKWKLSSDVAGATLMAVGSSAPELFISVIAIVMPGDVEHGGHAGIGLGTIVGSALFNVLVIIGATATVREAWLAKQPVIRDMLFYAISIIVLVLAILGGKIGMLVALIFVLAYIVYVFAVFKWRRWFPYKDIVDDVELPQTEEKEGAFSKIMKPFDFILSLFFPKKTGATYGFVMSIIIIGALCWALVESAVRVSDILHIPETIVALTVLAVGTSIPDLFSSIIVARQGKGGMAVSNAFGSNIFDILIGLGLPWLLLMLFTDRTIPVHDDNLIRSILLLFGSIVVVGGLFIWRKWRIRPKMGYFLIFLYVFYVVYEILDYYLFS